MKYLPIVEPKLFPKSTNAQNLLKFDTSYISSMLNSILKERISFMEYLPPSRPKLVPKLKMYGGYRNLAHWKLEICQCRL